ncbi:MAG: replicative DNA helicase [Planctomycetota bacterium]|jgi:replicative DNA helicase|nr:replicative DNA helicase [Planctomycetota bacterium]
MDESWESREEPEGSAGSGPWQAGGANPHNLEAEQALLGGLLLEPEQFDLVDGRITDEDFFIASHGMVFQAMRNLRKKGRALDPVLLRNELSAAGRLDLVGGAAGLVLLTDTAVSGANVEYYADIVRDLSARRKLIQTLNASLAAASAPGGPGITDLLGEAEIGIRAITSSDFHGQVLTLKEAINRTWDNIEKFKGGRGQADSILTGYPELDHLLTGLHDDELIIIAARPSMGKTTLALNLARNVAIRARRPAALFTLEMSAENIARNLLAACAQVDGQKLRDFTLSQEDMTRLGIASDELNDAPLWVDETPAISLAELRGKARRLKLSHSIRLILVDYLQLMTASNLARNRSREQEVSEISRGLKALAKELHLPIIALSQLSRKPEGRQDPRPILSDLRESGAIEQDADVVLMLHRPEIYKEGERPGEADLIIAKQRNGPTGKVPLAFIGQQLRFEPLARTGYVATD